MSMINFLDTNNIDTVINLTKNNKINWERDCFQNYVYHGYYEENNEKYSFRLMEFPTLIDVISTKYINNNCDEYFDRSIINFDSQYNELKKLIEIIKM